TMPGTPPWRPAATASASACSKPPPASQRCRKSLSCSPISMSRCPRNTPRSATARTAAWRWPCCWRRCAATAATSPSRLRASAPATRRGRPRPSRRATSCAFCCPARASGSRPAASRAGGGAVPLLRRMNYLWRLAATGLAFAVMGVGGIVLALVVPLASLGTRDPLVRARRARRYIRNSFRGYLLMLRWLGVLRLEVVGGERLAQCQGRLIVANHPTLLDVVLIMALVPNAHCVAKHQLWRNPFLGPIMRISGHIRNDGDAEAFIDACRSALAAGGNLIIFPEGTRSVPGQRLRFQRGFAHIATLTGANLQLVAITCEPVTLIKGQP